MWEFEQGSIPEEQTNARALGVGSPEPGVPSARSKLRPERRVGGHPGDFPAGPAAINIECGATQ